MVTGGFVICHHVQNVLRVPSVKHKSSSGCISVFVRSRSDPAKVAFKPRLQGKPGVRRRATVEINAGKRIQASLRDATVGKTFPVG
jgi:hypothetical protein